MRTQEHMQEALLGCRSEGGELSEEARRLERMVVYLMFACACAAVQDSVLARQSGHSVAGPQVSFATVWDSVGSVKSGSTLSASEQGDYSDYSSSAESDLLLDGDLAWAGDVDFTYVDYTGNPEFCDGGVPSWL